MQLNSAIARQDIYSLLNTILKKHFSTYNSCLFLFTHMPVTSQILTQKQSE